MRAAFVLVTVTAVAALPPLPDRIDLDRASAIRVQLPTLNAPRVSVGDVGDVNGDGRGDIGVRTVQGHGGDAQRSFVVFGGGGPRTIPRTRLRSTGFQIARGPAIAAAGDLDLDGLADLIVSDGLAGTLGIAYGRRSPGTLDPRLSGRVGYAITGLGTYYPSAARGGLRDTRRHLLVGNCDSLLNKTGPGRAYLLPTRGRGAARVHAPAAAMLRITGRRFVCPIGLADVNGDRRDDAIVSDGTRSVYVVFDARRRASVNLASLGGQGFRITASRGNVFATLAGDVNEDGRSDIFFIDGTPDTAYVVFGKTTTSTVAVARLGAAGLTIRGERNTAFPSSTAAAGDVNGDGLGDVLLGAPSALPLGDGYEGGSVYLVYGRTSGGAVDLTATGPAFMRIDGTLPLRRFGGGIGGSVASIADLDGDRRRELAVADGYDGIAHVLLSTRLPR